MKRLPDTELEVMKALWKLGADTPRAALDQALEDFGWASNTVNTYLARLAEKGFVSVRREGKSNRYTPLVSQERPRRIALRRGTAALPEILWRLWPEPG